MDKNSHLENFNGQCSFFMSEEAYRRFCRGQEMVGRPPDENDPLGSNFVSTYTGSDNVIAESNGDISKFEASLGFPEGHFGDGAVIRVDINNPEEHGLRMANGREAGANEFYNTPLDENGVLPNIQYCYDADVSKCVDTAKTDPHELSKLNGQYWDQNGQYHPPNSDGYPGKTSGGRDEAVINQVPNTPDNISYTRIDGFKRGEASNLNSSPITSGYANYSTLSETNNQIAGELPPQAPTNNAPENQVIAGELPPATPKEPQNDTSISGTTPDKAQGIDLSKNEPDGISGNGLAEDAAKKSGTRFNPNNGIT